MIYNNEKLKEIMIFNFFAVSFAVIMNIIF